MNMNIAKNHLWTFPLCHLHKFSAGRVDVDTFDCVQSFLSAVLCRLPFRASKATSPVWHKSFLKRRLCCFKWGPFFRKHLVPLLDEMPLMLTAAVCWKKMEGCGCGLLFDTNHPILLVKLWNTVKPSLSCLGLIWFLRHHRTTFLSMLGRFGKVEW